MDAQLAFGSDILMVLDECPEYPVSHEYARETMQRTVRWARQAQPAFPEAHGAKARRATRCSRSSRARCSRTCGASAPRALVELDAAGYAIGGLSVGEPRPLSMEMVEATEAILPRDRPRYAMGVGMPAELPEYVARGVDMMDCVLPSRNARNGYLFTSEGRVIIKHARYQGRCRPAGPEVPVLHLSQAIPERILRHLFQSGEILYSVLATRHNIQRYLDIMREIRHAIISGSFPEYLRVCALGRR